MCKTTDVKLETPVAAEPDTRRKRPRGEQFRNPKRQLLSGESISDMPAEVAVSETETDHTVPPPGVS